MPDEIDEMLSGLERTGGGTEKSAGGTPPPAGSSDPGQVIDLGEGRKVSRSDVLAALGRQAEASRTIERYRKYDPLIAEFENEKYGGQLQQEAANRIIELQRALAQPDPTKPIDLEALKRTNPIQWAEELNKQRQEEIRSIKERYEMDHLLSEEKELKKEFKLSDKELLEVEAIAERMRDAETGEPIPLKDAYFMWDAPKVREREKQLQEEINKRPSVIPGGRASVQVSKKHPKDMTEAERRASMTADLYEAQAREEQARAAKRRG